MHPNNECHIHTIFAIFRFRRKRLDLWHGVGKMLDAMNRRNFEFFDLQKGGRKRSYSGSSSSSHLPSSNVRFEKKRRIVKY